MISHTTEPVTAIRRDLTHAEYLAGPGLSQSTAKKFDPETDPKGSPKCFRTAVEHPELWSDTATFAAGRQFHAFLLEPDTFTERHAVLDEDRCEALFAEALAEGAEKKSRAAYMNFPDYRAYCDAGKAGDFSKLGTVKTWIADQTAAGRDVVKQSRLIEMKRMRDAIRHEPEVWKELDGIDPVDCEVTAYAPVEVRRDSGHLIQLRARPDILKIKDGAVLDLKTCRESNPFQFARGVDRYGYDIQAAWYLDVLHIAGIEADRFGFVAVDSAPPYFAALHWMPEDWITYGRRRMERLLSGIDGCIQSGRWPGYGAGELQPPPYLEEVIEMAQGG